MDFGFLLDYDLSNYVISSIDDIKTLINLGDFNVNYYCFIYDNGNGDYNSYITLLMFFSGANATAENDVTIPNNIKIEREKYYEVVKFLLDNGAYPNIRHVEGDTALGYACNHDDNVEPEDVIKMVKLLLKKGSDPNVGSYKKPLYYAIEMGPPEVVELLLKAGADPNEIAELNEIEYDKTPLQLALGSNYTLYDNTLENFKLLLKYGANPNTFLPGYNGNLNVLEDILMNYAGDDAMPRELQIELVNLLLNYGINPSVEIQNSLWYQGIERIINKKMLQISGVYRNPMTGKIAYKQQSAEDLSSLPIGVKSRIKDFLFSQKHKKIIKRRKRSKNK